MQESQESGNVQEPEGSGHKSGMSKKGPEQEDGWVGIHIYDLLVVRD